MSRHYTCARDLEPDCPCKHCLATKGPLYPELGPSVAKWRRIPRAEMTPEQSAAHAGAIEQRIRYLQRVALLGNREAAHSCPCASGTWHNMADGAIGKAVREQQARALAAYPSQVRRARLDGMWVSMYALAMGRTEEEVWDSVRPR